MQHLRRCIYRPNETPQPMAKSLMASISKLLGLRVNDTDLAFCGRPGPKNNASKSRLSILPANDVITLDHRGYPHSRASVFHAFLHADDLS